MNYRTAYLVTRGTHEEGSTLKRFLLFDDKVEVVVTERADGNMKAVPAMDKAALQQTLRNRLAAVEALGLDAATTALVRVTYDTQDFCKFMMLATTEGMGLQDGFAVRHSDGLLTTTQGLGLFLPLADCLGIILYDPKERVLMLVHCGRHTLLQQGAAKALRFMQEHTGSHPSDIQAWFSPCAGKESYPLYEADNKGLQEYAAEQLTQAGVASEALVLSGIDTTCSPDYFSHSKGDTEDRFAICATLVGSHHD